LLAPPAFAILVAGRPSRAADVLRAGRKSPPAVRVTKPKPASAFLSWKPCWNPRGRRVSRFGVTPKPTV